MTNPTKTPKERMNAPDRRRCIDLRCRSKWGQYLHPDDVAFLERMWKQHPTEYHEIGLIAFEETKPFGAA